MDRFESFELIPVSKSHDVLITKFSNSDNVIKLTLVSKDKMGPFTEIRIPVTILFAKTFACKWFLPVTHLSPQNKI